MPACQLSTPRPCWRELRKDVRMKDSLGRLESASVGMRTRLGSETQARSVHPTSRRPKPRSWCCSRCPGQRLCRCPRPSRRCRQRP
eukprot:1662960-Alexandrium_andersonii.AAC.2